MLAKDLITDEIPPLKLTDTGLKALGWMDELKVTHLPIINKHELVGLISETDILDLNDPDSQLGKQKLSLIRPFVYGHLHIYEVLKAIAVLHVSIIPVLDSEENYLGLITQKKLIQCIAEMTDAGEPGGIVVLELNVNDYSMTHIAQMVEGNDAKILSSYVTTHKDSTKLDLTLKINKQDISAILQTFTRFNYMIKASFHQSGLLEDTKNRFDSFMNYINI
ncbi:MAG TPA: CBS domain-containing protein [Bacteroidia bacterium]|nr:CBS domain-containing protein [Bacteroidia bacterium]